MPKSDALYRKEHWFAIKLKNQMYKKLPATKELARKNNRKRKEYYKSYYEKNRDKFIQKSFLWAQQNRERKRMHQKRYKERLRRKNLDNRQKIKRIIEEFIEYCKDRYKKDTIRLYRKNMGRFLIYLIDKPKIRSKEYYIKWYEERKKPPQERNFSWLKEYHKIRFMEDINKELITDYISYVNHDEINDKDIKLNQSEKESRLYPLKTFLLYCQRRGYIKKDLRKFIFVPPREKKALKRALTPDEMVTLLEAPGDKDIVRIRDRALLELSYSGFRANEMLNLKLKDIDLDTNAVTILNAKNDKNRVVPMTTEAIYWIRRWLTRRNDYIKSTEDKDYIFATKKGLPITRRNFLSMIKKYAKKVNIPLDVSPHDLRRATATHLAELGAPIRLIQALLGHATLKVTTKYLRLTDEKIKKEHKETHPSNRRDLYYGKLQR